MSTPKKVLIVLVGLMLVTCCTCLMIAAVEVSGENPEQAIPWAMASLLAYWMASSGGELLKEDDQ